MMTLTLRAVPAESGEGVQTHTFVHDGMCLMSICAARVRWGLVAEGRR